MAPVLGYWKIRGYGQPIRLMLAYTETKYEERTYNYGPPPEYDKSDWRNVKYTLGLYFPNLPYYIDGDVKLTQSLAIMRHLARKHDLEPEDEDGRSRADMVEHQAIDIRTELAGLCYSPEFEKRKVEYLKTLPALIKEFSDFLGNRQWFAGDKLTYVDFLVYEVLDHHRIFAPGCLNHHQNLKEFFDRFEVVREHCWEGYGMALDACNDALASFPYHQRRPQTNLPTIQKYMKSENFLKWPLYGDVANFGSRRSKP